MNKHDLEFEKYLCKKDFIDIMNVFDALEGMPLDVDDDIVESTYEVAKSSREEFLEAIHNLNFPKENLDIVNQKYNEIVNKIEKAGLPAVINNNFDKKFEESDSEISKESFYEWYNYYKKWLNASDEDFEEHSKILTKSSLNDNSSSYLPSNEEKNILSALKHDRKYQKTEERIKESIKNYLYSLYSNINYRKLDNSYLINNTSQEPSNDEIGKWYDYFQKWINEPEDSFIQKRDELGITMEGYNAKASSELTPEELLEQSIFRSVLITKILNSKGCEF